MNKLDLRTPSMKPYGFPKGKKLLDKLEVIQHRPAKPPGWLDILWMKFNGKKRAIGGASMTAGAYLIDKTPWAWILITIGILFGGTGLAHAAGKNSSFGKQGEFGVSELAQVGKYLLTGRKEIHMLDFQEIRENMNNILDDVEAAIQEDSAGGKTITKAEWLNLGVKNLAKLGIDIVD